MRCPPLYIEIALWYHCRPNDYQHFGLTKNEWTDVVKQFVSDMVSNGILQCSASGSGVEYTMTEKGHAWVGFICDTPFPISQWVLP